MSTTLPSFPARTARWRQRRLSGHIPSRSDEAAVRRPLPPFPPSLASVVAGLCGRFAGQRNVSTRDVLLSDVHWCVERVVDRCGARADPGSTLLSSMACIALTHTDAAEAAALLASLLSSSSDGFDCTANGAAVMLATLDDLLLRLCPSIPLHFAAVCTHSSLALWPLLSTLWGTAAPVCIPIALFDAACTWGPAGLLVASAQLATACEGMLLSCTHADAVPGAVTALLSRSGGDEGLLRLDGDVISLANTLLAKNTFLTALCCVPRIPSPLTYAPLS